MALQGAIAVDTGKCKGCGVCIVHCLAGTIALSKEVNAKGYHYLYMANPATCTGCTNCATVCPDACITVYRAKSPLSPTGETRGK
jgi:2-oxoglutarate ferredoxin oxidoreductase subunit delta